jgi:hypothetical protein
MASLTRFNYSQVSSDLGQFSLPMDESELSEPDDLLNYSGGGFVVLYGPFADIFKLGRGVFKLQATSTVKLRSFEC